MSFTFDTTIPNAPNNPSVDQPGMLQNNVSTNGILSVDHITFNALGGGQHKQVTFNGRNVPVAQTDPQAVLYTNTVTATATNTASASTVSELFFRNQNAGVANNAFPISMIKAFGIFDSAGTPLNTWNMTFNAHSSAGNYSITLPPNIVTGSNYLVIFSNTGNGSNSVIKGSYIINSATSFSFQFVNQTGTAFADPNSFSVLIMQL